jgi:hypothetical protein
MKVFKETTSYKLISLLDEFKYKKKYINILLITIILYKFQISRFILTKRRVSNNKKIELFFELVKERLYLEKLVETHGIDTTSRIGYSIIKNILLAEINYNSIRFNIEYTISDNEYTIYITVNGRCFNATDENLNIEPIYKTFNDVLYLLFMDIIYILNEIFNTY